LHGVRELRFVTPRGTDLRLGVAGRTWINCDGHENFPDGEVFTGPAEDATEGTACFDVPAVHGGREGQGVRLVFRAGRVVEASTAPGRGRTAEPERGRRRWARTRPGGASGDDAQLLTDLGEGLGRLKELLRRVGGRHLNADAGLAVRDHGVAEADHVDAVGQQA